MPKLILSAAVLLALIASARGGGAPKSMIGVMEAMSATPKPKPSNRKQLPRHLRRRTAGMPTTTEYDSHGAYSGRSTYSGNSMGSDRRTYSGQAAASSGGMMRHYDSRGRNVGSSAR